MKEYGVQARASGRDGLPVEVHGWERERGPTRACSQCGESQVPDADRATCSVTKGLLEMSNLGPNSRNRGFGLKKGRLVGQTRLT